LAIAIFFLISFIHAKVSHSNEAKGMNENFVVFFQQFLVELQLSIGFYDLIGYEDSSDDDDQTHDDSK
jgi:hypothetical protein